MAYNKSSVELEYIFIGMKFNVEFLAGVFTDEEENDIRDFIDKMSKTICIDKTYVECSQNKRKNTFMLESGWNSLKDFIIDSRYCKYMHNQSEEIIVDAFATMGRCYMYECLALKTDKFSNVNITVQNDSEFEVVICKDESNDYKKYLGKWQEWEYDDYGNFLSSHATDINNNEVNINDEQHG